jgi:hypothetical protein
MMPLIGMDKVKKMTEQAYVDLNNELRGNYLSAFSLIIKGTPVDTGRARNNWFLTTGSPSEDSTNRAGGNSNKQLNQMPKKVLNETVYLTNNLPYIEKLEYGGTSSQAPAGWVRQALILLENKIRLL